MDITENVSTSTSSTNFIFKKPEIIPAEVPLLTTGKHEIQVTHENIVDSSTHTTDEPDRTPTHHSDPQQNNHHIIDLSEFDSPESAKPHLNDETEQLSSGSEISTCSEIHDDEEMSQHSPHHIQEVTEKLDGLITEKFEKPETLEIKNVDNVGSEHDEPQQDDQISTSESTSLPDSSQHKINNEVFDDKNEEEIREVDENKEDESLVNLKQESCTEEKMTESTSIDLPCVEESEKQEDSSSLAEIMTVDELSSSQVPSFQENTKSDDSPKNLESQEQPIEDSSMKNNELTVVQETETKTPESVEENVIESTQKSCDIVEAKEDPPSKVEENGEDHHVEPVPMEIESIKLQTQTQQPPNGSIFSVVEDSNFSTDSEGLVIDQEASYPTRKVVEPLQQPSFLPKNLNGFDLNNYLKRKISAVIEEGIVGSPPAPKRKYKPRNNRRNNGKTITQAQKPSETLLEEYLRNAKPLPERLPELPHPDIGDIFDVAAQSSIQPAAPPPTAPSSFPFAGVASTSSSAKDSRNDPNPRRKVFLCSSCHQHYENWNLFLHMRDVHKRFTCLYCMGIFNNAEKLLAHLENKHSISKKFYNDKDDILNSYKNMYNSRLYLMCIECEHVFDETEEFTHHSCERYIEPCTVCGQRKKCKHKEGNKKPSPQSTKQRTNNNQLIEDAKTQQFLFSPVQQPQLPSPLEMPNQENVSPLRSVSTTPATPTRHHQQGAATPSSAGGGGGSLKMKFKFNRISNSKDSPCKITVEAPQLLQPEPEKEPVPPVELFPSQPIQEESQISNNPIYSSFSTLLQPPAPLPVDFDFSSESAKVLQHAVYGDQLNVHSQFAAPFPALLSKEDAINSTVSIGSFSASEMLFSSESTTPSPQLTLPKPFTHWGQCMNSSAEEVKEEEEDSEKSSPPPPPLVPKLRLTIPKNFKPIESEESSTESDDDQQVPEMEEKVKVDETPEIEAKVFNEDVKVKMSNAGSPIAEIKENSPEPLSQKEEEEVAEFDGIEVADEDTQLHDLQLDQPLDKIDLVLLLKSCLEKTVPFCLYCYHARRIAVNGRGLALHLIGSHRFQATVDSITAEELKPETFVAKFKASLVELDTVFLNSDNRYCSIGNTISTVEYPKETFYECMQCRYTTGTHKELYVHNRKLHLRSKLICIMCKIPFYSFCDLICHMCPGISNQFTILDLEFRCCLCNLDRIPSAFRLMIHLRRRHFACDVCVEICHDTLRLSSHVWKHKLHHLCYRCGIAYRNKADIQKHLFWRHGTESVQCKRCLQKKWPHVYHFCMPQAIFSCETCGLQFTRAVSLRVHKRLHTGEAQYPCTEESCEKKFISKKLLLKHVARHNEPPPLPVPIVEEPIPEEKLPKVEEEKEKKKSKKRRKKDDILDLCNFSGPNLSESDSSDESDGEKPPDSPVQVEEKIENPASSSNIEETEASKEESPKESREVEPPKLEETVEQKVEAVPDIWANFKNYQESQGKSMEIDERLDDKEEDACINEVSMDIDKDISLTQEAAPVTVAKDSEALEDSKSDGTLSADEEILEMSDEDYYKRFKPDLFTCQSDHDYCKMYEPVKNFVVDDFESEIQASVIQDYAKLLRDEREKEQKFRAEQRAKFFKSGSESPKQPQETQPTTSKQQVRKRTTSTSSSSSSSGSDSDSSCSCGSSCSCSSSSSSSDSDSEAERRKHLDKKLKTPPPPPPEPVDPDSIMLESDLETTESETDEEFYDEHPQKLANQQLADKRRQLMLQHSLDPNNAHGIIENSRSSTPSLPEEVIKSEKKSKNKKRKKEKKEKVPSLKLTIPKLSISKSQVAKDNRKLEEVFQNAIQQAYEQVQTVEVVPEPQPAQYVYHQPQEIPSPQVILSEPSTPNTPVAAKVQTPTVNPILASMPSYQHPVPPPPISPFSSDGSRSKRQRKPNKFYGYDEEEEDGMNRIPDPYQPPTLTWDKDDLPSMSKPRPPAKRLSTSSKPSKSRTGSRVNSFDDLSSPVVIKSNILPVSKPPKLIEPLRISLSSLQTPSTSPGKLLDSDNEDLHIAYNEPKPKIPKLKLTGLNKQKPRKVITPRAPPRPKKPKRPLQNSGPMGPRLLSAANQIQLEQYPSSVTQTLYPTPPTSAPPDSLILSSPLIPAAQPSAQPATYYRNDVKYPIQPPANWRPAKEGEKVYCYCRCPYDEASEMIGCDDGNCKIEWFHFECVGILMPPSGKWYCPDCKPHHMHEFATDYETGSY